MTAAIRGGIPKSVLVVRLGAMGDVVHTMTAVAAVRAVFPEIKIGWAIEERWAELLCAPNNPLCGPPGPARPLVDSVHLVNTKKWRKSVLSSGTRAEMKSAFSDIRSQQYEVAADFQGALKSALVARFAGAGTIVGMANPRETPARIFYKQRAATSGTHVIEQYRSVAENVAGRKLPLAAPEFPCDEGAKKTIESKFGSRPVAILSPGAGWAAKEWPAAHYGEVARVLAHDGLQPVINFGPGEESLARAAEAASGGTATSISTSISELIALTRRARLFISGDTGPLHLAAALNVPAVAIFGPTDPARNGPYGTRNIVLRDPASQNSLSHTSNPDPGLLRITPDQVIAAARQLIEATHA